MIKVWEAHRDLSEAIGDSVGLGKYSENNPPTSIPDGVVFSRTLRDTFIYRSMLSVLRDKLFKLSMYPVGNRIDLYSQIFPNTILTETISGSILNSSRKGVLTTTPQRDILVLLSVRAETTNDRYFPVPVKTQKEISYLFNTGNAHSSGLMCAFNPANPQLGTKAQVIIYDQEEYFGILQSVDFVLTYLPYPRNPALATVSGGVGVYGWTDALDIEDAHYPEILSYARLLAMADSLDYDSGSFLVEELKILTGQSQTITRRQ